MASLSQTQFFADSYVFGFLQILAWHAAEEVSRKPLDPLILAALMPDTLDRFVPGYGRDISKETNKLINPNHPYNKNYTVGHHEAREYLRALQIGDLDLRHKMMESFRSFVRRNHITQI